MSGLATTLLVLAALGVASPLAGAQTTPAVTPTTSLDCERAPDDATRLACYQTLYKGIVKCTGAALAARLTCYDTVSKRVIPEGGPVPGRALLGWKVRSKVGVDTLGDYAADKEGATLEVGHSKGDSFSSVKLAALYIGAGGGKAGWNPFYGLGWKRDTSDPAKRSDTREITAGITGAITSVRGDSLGLHPTLTGTARKLVYTQGTELAATGHTDVYVPAMNFSNKSLAYSLVPVLGLTASSLEDNDPASADGVTVGAYAGVRFEYQPKDVFPRLTLSGKLQAYLDGKTPTGAPKRRTQYGLLSFGYDLADPETKVGWVPAIVLKFERGLDPVGGEGPARKVSLALTIRYD